jgi:hypothetical protein
MWRMTALNPPSNGMLKGYVQGAEDPNHYPLCRPLYALGLDALLAQSQAKIK